LPFIGAGAANALAGDGDTYSVASGDSLSAIAEEQGVEGGSQQLYEDDKSVIGDDPDLLSIGLKLTLDGPTDADTGSTTATQASYGSDTEETAPIAVLPADGGTLTAGFTTVRAATGGTVVSTGWDDAFG
jgi:hypothetical protein